MEKALKKVLLFLVIAAVAALSLRKLSNFDFWQHLSSGRYMVENGEILTQDVFSYTITGKQWLNHQWLSQVLLYLGWRAFGPEGLVLLKAIMLVAAFTIVLGIGYRRETYCISGGVVLLAALTVPGRLLVRPEAFTLFFIAVYLAVLCRFRSEPGERESSGWLIYILIPLQLLWANLHGGFIFGIGLIWVTIIGDVIDTRVLGRFHDEALRRRTLPLLTVGMLAVGVSLVNPWGWKLFLRPFLSLTSTMFMKEIGEWSPPFTGPPETRGFNQYFYAALLGISVVAILLNLKRTRCSSLLLFAALTYLSLKSRRNIALFALVAIPITVGNLNDLLGAWLTGDGVRARYGRMTISAAVILVSLFLLFAVSTNRYYIRDNSAAQFGIGLSHHAYPQEGADFILTSNVQGRVFNNYGIGSYLIWRFYPERGVFIDGRNDLYGEKFMEIVYKKALANPAFWDRVSSDYGIHSVIVRHSALEVKDLIQHLYKSREWVPCHLDGISIVFLRDSPETADIVRRSGLNLETIAVPKEAALPPDGEGFSQRLTSLLDRYPPKEHFPFDILRTATLFSTIGLHDQAAVFFREAAGRYPTSAEIHNSLGISLNEAGRPREAEVALRKALIRDPGHAAARNNLALSLIKQGRYAEAEHELVKVLSDRPDYVIAHNSLGLCYEKNGDLLKAREAWKRALELDPSFIAARLKLEAHRHPVTSSRHLSDMEAEE